jgi:hypothetical protein
VSGKQLVWEYRYLQSGEAGLDAAPTAARPPDIKF